MSDVMGGAAGRLDGVAADLADQQRGALRRGTGDPASLLIGLLLVVAGAALFVYLGRLIYTAFQDPLHRLELAQIGEREWFSWTRFVLFVVPFAAFAGVFVLGGVTVVRFRRGVSTTQSPGLLARGSVWASLAMVLLGLGAGVVALALWDVRTSASTVAVVIANVIVFALSVLVALKAIAILRSQVLHLGLAGVLLTFVVTALCLAIPLASVHLSTGQQDFQLNGFYGWSLDPHPRLAAPEQVICGDARHCLISGFATGDISVTTALATTAVGGSKWQSAVIGNSSPPGMGAYTCRATTCWAPLLAYTGPLVEISVRITSKGPVISYIPFTFSGLDKNLASQVDWLQASCPDASQCVVPIFNNRRVPLTLIRTDDAGRHWIKATIVPPSTVDPNGLSERLWCSDAGTCLLDVAGTRKSCTSAFACDVDMLYRSADGGSTWLPADAPQDLGASYQVHCDGPPVCVAEPAQTSLRLRTPLLFDVTTDFGASAWQVRSAPGLVAAGHATVTPLVACGLYGQCLAVSPGSFWRSNDFGAHWFGRYKPSAGYSSVTLGCGSGTACLLSTWGPFITPKMVLPARVAVTQVTGWTARILPQASVLPGPPTKG